MMKAKIILLVFTLHLYSISSSYAAPIGKFVCNAVNGIGTTKYLISIDMDKNELFLLKEGLDPNNPAAWKPFYSKDKHAYCGFCPADDSNVSCSFATEQGTDGRIAKNLGCNRVWNDGSQSSFTVGSLYLDPRNLNGRLRCSVYTGPTTDLMFSDCLSVSSQEVEK